MQSSSKSKRSLPVIPSASSRSTSQYKDKEYTRDDYPESSHRKSNRDDDYRGKTYSRSLEKAESVGGRSGYHHSSSYPESSDRYQRSYRDNYSPRQSRHDSPRRNYQSESYSSMSRDMYARYESRDTQSYDRSSPRRQYSSPFRDYTPMSENPNSWQRSSLPAKGKPKSPTNSWQRSSLPAHVRNRSSPTTTSNSFSNNRPPLMSSKSESYSSYDGKKKTSDFKSFLSSDYFGSKDKKYKQQRDPNAPFEMHFKHRRNSSLDVPSLHENKMKRSSTNYKEFEHSASMDDRYMTPSQQQQQQDLDESYKILKEGLQIRKSKQVYKFERSASEGTQPNNIYDDPRDSRRYNSSRFHNDYHRSDYDQYNSTDQYDSHYDYRSRNDFDRSSHYSSRSNPVDNASYGQIGHYSRSFNHYDTYRRSPTSFNNYNGSNHHRHHSSEMNVTQTSTQTDESALNFSHQYGYLHDPSRYNRYPEEIRPRRSFFSFNFLRNLTGKKKKTHDSKYIYMSSPSPQHCTQVLATLAVALGPLCAGLGKGYSSPALASMDTLSAQGKHFSISKDEQSWVASLSLLGAFFGSLPAGMSIKYGRKRVLCLVAIPFALSWILTVLATHVYMLYAASLLGGVCTAIIAVVTPVYISEIAHPDIRGCLCALSKLSSNIGMLLAYLLGTFLNWQQLATVMAFAPGMLFIAALLIPETPSYLLYRGCDTEAAASLAWLRSGRDVARELTTMKANIATLRKHEIKQPHSVAFRDLVRPLFITCGLMVFQKFSGANAFNFYAVPILSETFVGLDPYRAAVVVAFVQICAGMASSALVDTVGRRPLLVFSNMLMSAALAAFGGYVYLKGLDTNKDMFARQQWKQSDWIPLFCILVIEIAFALGVSPISWLYIGELFPLKHRGFGALAASVSYACSFASVKSFVDLQLTLGLYGTFWLYSSLSALALVFTLVFVPETKGLSLQEMQDTHKTMLV